jgi:SAM-dependent methyltransferase
MRYEEPVLRSYLVEGVEAPRLNLQSILTRHFLVRAVSGSAYEWLMEAEYRFSAVMNWVLNLAAQMPDEETMAAVLYALERGADNAEGVELPDHVVAAFGTLLKEGTRVPNYIRLFLKDYPAHSDAALNTFLQVWAKELSLLAPARKPVVLEAGCGSANDYRALDASGLVRLIEYRGFDICEKNVRNAQALFPGARFEHGNVFDIAAADRSCDYFFVHDLFEHFSLEGLEQAIAELCRVTRLGACAHFFNMHEGAEHVLKPVEDYHWNELSLRKVKQSLSAHGFSAQALNIGKFLEQWVRCPGTHNPNAYTLFLERC